MISAQTDIKALPFTISPSVSNLVFHAEENGASWLEFVAWYQDQKKYEVVRFTIQRLIGAKMGSVGGEAGAGGIGEVKDSRWLEEINAYQRKHYPGYPDNFKHVHHYFVVGHDDKIEFLAEGFTYQTVKALPNW